MSVHRGRTKAGNIPVSIRLTPSEYAALAAWAESQCRTRTGQIVWLIKQALKEVSDVKRK
jgi:hypothetical protein